MLFCNCKWCGKVACGSLSARSIAAVCGHLSCSGLAAEDEGCWSGHLKVGGWGASLAPPTPRSCSNGCISSATHCETLCIIFRSGGVVRDSLTSTPSRSATHFWSTGHSCLLKLLLSTGRHHVRALHEVSKTSFSGLLGTTKQTLVHKQG
jgi:hypothetical protein